MGQCIMAELIMPLKCTESGKFSNSVNTNSTTDACCRRRISLELLVKFRECPLGNSPRLSCEACRITVVTSLQVRRKPRREPEVVRRRSRFKWRISISGWNQLHEGRSSSYIMRQADVSGQTRCGIFAIRVLQLISGAPHRLCEFKTNSYSFQLMPVLRRRNGVYETMTRTALIIRGTLPP